MSLYDELGVSKAAAEDEIRHAYRKKAQANHPDKGGDVERFQQIQKAYAVLSDKDKRFIYDQTGQEPRPESDTAILSAIAQLLMQVIDSADVDYTDLIGAMRTHLHNAKAQMQSNIHAVEQKAARRRGAVKRLKHKGAGENVLARIIEAEIAKSEAAKAGINAEITKIERVEAAIKDYEYLFDEQQGVHYYGSSFGSTTSSSWR